MNEFLSSCRHLLVPLLFHEVTFLHLPSFQRNDFYTCILSEKRGVATLGAAVHAREQMVSFNVYREKLDDLPQQHKTREKRSLGDWSHLRRQSRRSDEVRMRYCDNK